MDKFEKYIKAAKFLYNDGYFDIVDTDNNFIAISDKNKDLLGIKELDNSYPIERINCEFVEAVDQIKQQNALVISEKRIIRFISMGKFHNGEYVINRGSKYPLVDDNGEAIGVLTISYPAKVIYFGSASLFLDGNKNNSNFTFELDGIQPLSLIEEQILFYSSLGFTQGEVYDFVSSYHEGELPLNTFKSYQFKLLKKFDMPDIDSVVNQIDALKNRRFIPKHLIRNKIISCNL